MGGDIKLEALGSGLHETVAEWATGARKKGRSDSSLRNSLTWKETGAAIPPDGGSDGAGSPVTRAPNERFGSSRNMLAPAAAAPEHDEIVAVVDIGDDADTLR
jgi:hypothetical protein